MATTQFYLRSYRQKLESPMRCFVIGPIGTQNSETRKNADHLFDYVIKPVLEKFNFQVVRSDRLSTVASITDEIIRLIQESELCIIDLTESNPNVFYETGRRHETGKPYIHLLQEGQKTPFDVQGTRYVSYKDLSISGNVFEAQTLLTGFVEVIAKTGFGASKSSNPLNNIEETLRRIELRLSVASSPAALSQASEATVDTTKIQSLDPSRKLIAFYEAGQHKNAETALIEFDDIYVDKHVVIKWAARLARLGRKVAADLLLKYLMDPIYLSSISGDAAADAFTALSRYYIVTGQAENGKATTLHLVDSMMREPVFKTFSTEESAVIVNAAQSICWDLDDLENSQKYGELICSLEPTEPIWISNFAMTLLKRKDYLRASSVFDSALAVYEATGASMTSEVLEVGLDIYSNLGQRQGIDHCLELLSRDHSGLADSIRKRWNL